MPKQPGRFAKIAITLPRELLVAADRRARELDRSRSWVIAESIRRATAEPGVQVPEPGASVQGTGIGDSRLAQLRADLRLSPEERVREAELTERTTRKPGSGQNSIVGFDRYEDYLDWKRRRDVGG